MNLFKFLPYCLFGFFLWLSPLLTQAKPITTLRVAMVEPPQTIDPIRLGSIYNSRLSAQVFETLLTYHYLKRPLALKPLLLKALPSVSKDGTVYTFVLKRGIFFHNSPCFSKGKGRELVAKDVLYSIKRMTHPALQTKGKWIYRTDVVGFKEFEQMMKMRYWRRQSLDMTLPMKGLRLLGKYQFQIVIKKASHSFLHLFTNQATAVVPHEVAECQRAFAMRRYPSGTGPFVLKRWGSRRIEFVKNTRYKHDRFPTSFSSDDRKNGFHNDTGKILPRVDRLVVLWGLTSLKVWDALWKKDIDYMILNQSFWRILFAKDMKLRPKFTKKGFYHRNILLLDFIYTGFQMKDPVVGGTTKRALYLRKAISHAIDLDEVNQRFYDGRVRIYQGVIPPGLHGFLGNRAKTNLALAKEFLKRAGYPNGKGLSTLTISVTGTSGTRALERVWQRQLARIGIKVRFDVMSFAQLSQKLRAGQVQMFSLAWGSDYPDAENNLMLFYGPNKAPGPNSWNYNNPLYNKLYRQLKGLSPSPHRTKILRQMNQILVDDAVFIGSMARPRVYIAHDRLKNFKPDETLASFWKYLYVIPQPSIHTIELPLWGRKILQWMNL